MKENFYCFACKNTTSIIIEDYRCPTCNEKIFNDEQEFFDYVLGEDKKPITKEPFSKPKKFKEF